MLMWREIIKISKHLNEEFKKGRYNPMRPESLPFTYKDLEDYCRANEQDIYEYIDPSERGGINGHPSYEPDIDDDDDIEEVE